MRQLTLQLDDKDMAQLELAAHSPLSQADTSRAKRLAAIMGVHGMWKGDPDKPQDAVAYQRKVRSEWP